jgi:tellurite resistance protein TerC
MDKMINHPGILSGFGILVIIMLLLDLGVFNKKSHAVSNKEAAIWSIVWISLSMIFSLVVYKVMGFTKFTQFQSAYWIEKALSVDNLFVFILVFGFFNVPKELHHKVLFWGIIGALVFRAIFIFTGVGLINITYLPAFEVGDLNFTLEHRDGVAVDYTARRFFRPNIVLTLFGIFLIYAGIKSWFANKDTDENKDFTKSPGARLVHRFFKVSTNFDGDKFFTVEKGIRMATPLLVVVCVIEFTDLLFAVDSIPAIFAIAPDDPFILYTSNIFAILGLRALYFLLANFIYMFRLLKYGLAIILTFIGIKMVIAPFFHISSPLSLTIVGGVLILSVVASLITTGKENKDEKAHSEVKETTEG